MTEKVEAHTQAINVVNDYKKFNQNTIERVRQYDPKLKAWIFTKEAIDTNAFQFKKIHIIPKKKKKNISQKLRSIDHLAPCKSKTAKVKTLINDINFNNPELLYNNLKEHQEIIINAEGENIIVNKNTYCLIYYKMYKSGKSVREIAAECNKDFHYVHRDLKYYNEKWNLGLEFQKLPPKPRNETRNLLLKYLKKGITSPKKLERLTGIKYRAIMAQKATMKKLGLIKY
ncbi:hypothetical protein ACMGDK_11240 [Chryseobacterium sp. DT-3]|uniref:hypothetical protein n=1 Tax=Chryseobacterium sp. DT-3 TaxID=3396164 RepID=UPI003F1E3B0D